MSRTSIQSSNGKLRSTSGGESLERLDEIWLEALEQKTKGLAGRIARSEWPAGRRR